MDTLSKRVIKKEIRDNNKILLYAIALFSIGVVFILSSSSAGLIMNGDNNIAAFAKKQILYGVLSLVVGTIIYKMSVKYVLDNVHLLFYATIGILIVVLLVAKEINGARSWLQIGGFSLQPAEFAKITLIIMVATALKSQDVNSIETYKKLCFSALPIMILIVLQKDLGTVMIMGAIVLVMMYLGGIKKSILGGIAGAGLVGILVLSILSPYRMQRMLIFMNPFEDYYGMGYQIIQSLYSVATGGIFGQGLGNSIHKYGYLPENHTDFIFAVVTEEVGLLGAGLIILLFILLVTQILKIAFKLKNKQHSLIVAGIGCFIAIESLLNLFVVVSLMPVTGVTLPFISYGGSSLISKSICLAIVLNINRNSSKVDGKHLDLEKQHHNMQRAQQRKTAKVKVKSFKDTLKNSISNGTSGLISVLSIVHSKVKHTVIENTKKVFSISKKSSKQFKTHTKTTFSKNKQFKKSIASIKIKTSKDDKSSATIKKSKGIKKNSKTFKSLPKQKGKNLQEIYLESKGFNAEIDNDLKEINLDEIDIKKFNS